MAKPIHNLQLSQRSIDALNEIRHDIGLSKIGLTFISTGHVISPIMGNSGNSSRVITIAFSEWEDYQRLSDWGGVAAIYKYYFNDYSEKSLLDDNKFSRRR